MKKIIFMLSLLIFSISVFSQTLMEEAKVPKPVKEAFKKKAAKATEVKWYKVKEGFMVKCIFAGQEEETTFTKAGEIVKYKVKMDAEKLPKIILEDLKAKHKKKEIVEVYIVSEGKKEKYYSIILHEKEKKKDEPKVYEILYSDRGKFITIYEPEEEVVTTEEEEVKEDKTDVKIEEEAENLAGEVDGEKVKPKDLPTPILEYMKTTYSYEYQYKVCQIVQHETHGESYYIIMKKQGEKKQFVHYFDTNGKLLEVIEQ